jgi:uncharacterized protein
MSAYFCAAPHTSYFTIAQAIICASNFTRSDRSFQLFSLYGLWRPTLKPIKARAMVGDLGAGFLNGVLGGATGLAGIVAVIWCQLRGWAKDQQRAVFQPVGVATFAMSAAWLGGQGSVSREVIPLVVVALPIVLAGTWLGLKFYGRLDEAQFRKLMLILRLASGAVLLFH